MLLTVRLDPRTEGLVKRLARKKGRTKSDVIREALVALAKEEAEPLAVSPYDAIAHLIGCVDLGDEPLSERTGERFRSLLEAKARARRSR